MPSTPRAGIPPNPCPLGDILSLGDASMDGVWVGAQEQLVGCSVPGMESSASLTLLGMTRAWAALGLASVIPSVFNGWIMPC